MFQKINFSITCTISAFLTLANIHSLLSISIKPSAHTYHKAVLSETGTFSGDFTLTNGDTLILGNGINQFIIDGSYAQNNSTYFVQFNGTGQSSLIYITDDATIGPNSQIVASSIDNSYAIDQPYTILYAAQGVSGSFLNAVSTNPLFTPVLTYDFNDVYLTLTTPLSSIGNNSNQTGVLNYLMEGISDPSSAQYNILSVLSTLPAAQAQRSLQQMSGEIYTNTLLISELANRQFIRRLFDPIRHLLKSSSCFDEDLFEEDNYYNCYEYNDLCYAYGDPLEIKSEQDNISFWLDVGGGQSLLKHDHNAGGFKLSNIEVSLGGHSSLNQCWTLGVGIGYEYDDTHYNIGGSGNTSTALIGLYSLYRSHIFYLISDFVFGYNQTKIKRLVDLGEVHFQEHANQKTYQGTFYVEAGKNFHYGILNFQPFFGLEVDYFNSPNFKEHRTAFLDLSFQRKNSTSASSRLGLHFASEGPSCLSFNLDVAWQCRFTSLSNSLKAQFANLANPFTVHGAALSQNSFDAEALIAAKINDSWNLYTEFSGQRWERAATYSITGGVMGKW